MGSRLLLFFSVSLSWENHGSYYICTSFRHLQFNGSDYLIAKLFISFSLRSILLNIRTCFCLSSIILFHVNESLFVCPSFSIYGQTVFQTVYTQFFFSRSFHTFGQKKVFLLKV